MTSSHLDRLDALLGAFDDEHVTLSSGGLVARTGLPRTTVHRHVTAMVRCGWLTREAGRYRLGDRLFELGSATRLHTRLRGPAAASLHELAVATRRTVHLGVLDGTDVLYVDKIDGRGPVTTGITRVGGRRPAHCTAIGKALVAWSGEDARARLLSTRLRPYTAATIVEPTRLDVELRRVADDGLATDREESAVGLSCLAAPVLAADGRCVAAVSVSGRVDRSGPTNLVTMLRETAAACSSQLVK